MSNKKPEEKFAEDCANGVNSLSFSPKIFIEAMSRQHRTLQQNFTRVCFEWIKHMAEKQEGDYDGRNEASVKACKKILERVDEYDLSLPLI